MNVPPAARACLLLWYKDLHYYQNFSIHMINDICLSRKNWNYKKEHLTYTTTHLFRCTIRTCLSYINIIYILHIIIYRWIFPYSRTYLYIYKSKAPISIFSVTYYSSSRFVTCWEKVLVYTSLTLYSLCKITPLSVNARTILKILFLNIHGATFLYLNF